MKSEIDNFNAYGNFTKINSKDAAKVLAKQACKKHGDPPQILSAEDEEETIPEKKLKMGPRTRSKLQ